MTMGRDDLPPFRHYLLVFDREQQQLLDLIDFGEDSESAVAAYAPKEREYAGNPRIEVVLLGSDSIETLKVTHGNYFGTIPYIGRLPAKTPVR
jgi:hypothetical protein